VKFGRVERAARPELKHAMLVVCRDGPLGFHVYRLPG
jgi:hypothetical protein